MRTIRVLIAFLPYVTVGLLSAQAPKDLLKDFYSSLASARSYIVKARVEMKDAGTGKVRANERMEAYWSKERMLTVMPGRTAMLTSKIFLMVDDAEHTIYLQSRSGAQIPYSVKPDDLLAEVSKLVDTEAGSMHILCTDETTVTLRLTQPQPGYEYADVTLRRSNHMPTTIAYKLATAVGQGDQGFDTVVVTYTELKLDCALPDQPFDEARYVKYTSGGEALPAASYKGYRIIRPNAK